MLKPMQIFITKRLQPNQTINKDCCARTLFDAIPFHLCLSKKMVNMFFVDSAWQNINDLTCPSPASNDFLISPQYFQSPFQHNQKSYNSFKGAQKS
jgi:hypothetical protein